MSNPFDNPFDSQAATSAKTPFDATVPGQVVNFFAAVPESTYNVGKSFIQGLFRIPAEFGISAAQAGLGIADRFLGTSFAPKSDQGIPTDGLQALLGSEPLKGYASQILDLTESIQGSSFAKNVGLDKHAMPLAFAGIVGGEALNFIGGEENAAKTALKTIAKETNPETIVKILIHDLKIDPYIAEQAATHLAKTSDIREIKATIGTLHGAQAIQETAPAGLLEHGPAAKPLEARIMETYKMPAARVEQLSSIFDLPLEKKVATLSETLGKDANEIGHAIYNQLRIEKDFFLKDNGFGEGFGKDGKTIDLEAISAWQKHFTEKYQINPTEINSPQKLLDYVGKKLQELPAVSAPPEAPGAAAAIDETPAQVSVGEGTQASRAAQEEAAAAAGPRAIQDKIQLPSSGEVELASGRKTPIEASPADVMSSFSKEPDAKSWKALVKGYMYNFSPSKRAHFFDYLATPEFVLEKVGLGKGAELLQDAKDVYRKTLKAEFSKISDWQKRVPSPDAKRVIFQYLDGRESDVVRDMTPEEHAVAKEIRVYLKDWAKRLKLPDDNQISRYITHIFERDFAGAPEENFVDPELNAIMSENVAKSVYDPFLQKRLGKPGYVEDVWRALDAYVKRASRKEAMDPALEELSSMAKQLDDRTYNYVKSLSHRVNMRPTELEKAMDSFITQTPIGQKFTNRPTAFISRKIRQIFYRGTLGLNFSSALRNLTQGANTYAKLGEKYTVIGYAKLFSKMASRNLDELFTEGIIDDGLLQDRNIGAIRKGVQKMDEGLFSLFSFAEKINRGSAYFGAKAQGLKKGLSEEQAIKYAKRMVRETQFAFGAVDTPVALNDDVVKTLTQLQSYNIKQGEFLGRMLKQKDVAGLVRWSAASVAMLYTIGRLFGMTAAQIIPTVGLGGAPLTSTILNIPGLFSSDPQTKAKAVSQLQRNLSTLVPAGAQIRKTIQGAAAYAKGKDTTATGKFRFRVDQDPETLIRTLLFGKNSLPQAQKYYDSLGKKKETVGNPFD